jgi:hypothetical protein
MSLAMAGYSGTPLPLKLGLKPGTRLGVLHPPDDLTTILGPLPVGVVPRRIAPGAGKPTSRASADSFDVILCFVRALEAVDGAFAVLGRLLDPAGGLWLCWPKRASGIVTDVSENEIRRRGLASGLVDNKVCAVDEIWSGLRFVVRLADRPKTGTR